MSDIDEIKELRTLDENACVNRDFITLRAIMSNDAIIMPPDTGFISGKTNIDSVFAQKNKANSNSVLEYKIDFEDPLIIGDYAIEHGTISGVTLIDGKKIHSSFKALRVLKKESGSWKIYRTIWNSMPLK